MSSCKIVEKLMKFVPVLNDVLLMSVLRLLHNLSFDHSLRDDMVKHGLIPKVRLHLCLHPCLRLCLRKCLPPSCSGMRVHWWRRPAGAMCSMVSCYGLVGPT